MSRLLSSLGIGAATIETVLPRDEFVPGETLEATIEVEGGSADQQVDALYFTLRTNVDGEDSVIGESTLAESFTITSEESRTLTTDVTIPPWTPVTRDDRRVRLQTGLDVAWAVDPSDEVDVEVVPGPYVAAVLAATEDLGFDYRDSSVREPEWEDDHPLVQAFTFDPGTSGFGEDVEELTLVVRPREDDCRVIVEIDEREEAEAHAEVAYDQQEIVKSVDTTNVDMIRRQLQTTIDSHTNS